MKPSLLRSKVYYEVHMTRVLHTARISNFVIDLAYRGVCGLVFRASERGIRGSEVRFRMGTQNFFLCSTLVTRRKKNIFLYFFTELKTHHLSYSLSVFFGAQANHNTNHVLAIF